MNNEWITDRKPREDDGPMIYGPDGKVCHYTWIHSGDPWKPIPKCEPYVKPKRWRVEYNIFYPCWSLIDSYHVTYLSQLNQNTDEHREAAERIAAIYEEVMP